MLEVNAQIRIPPEELEWSYARAGGPGGQNVNKVSSKAVLRWDVRNSPSVPGDVKARFEAQQRQRITTEGVLVMSSQRYRDQERNREDCLEKLRELLVQAATVEKPRKKSKPTRASKRRRVEEKRRRAATKQGRRRPAREE
jgi:ribosome-associated protein